ncbi:MAG TPA: alpha/beta hydrolase [Pseudonocardiaceae bacterium]
MSHRWRTVGLVAGVAGALVAGTAIGAVTRGRRRRRRATEPALGDLAPDREHTVLADDGVELAVAEVDPADGGRPDLTVVLVHGFVVDRRMWHFQRVGLPELTDPRVRVVLYDQRSHGRSGRSSRHASTIEQLGRDLDAVVRATAPCGQVVLVGHSMGAMTIMALAEQRPELFERRVAGVALLCTSAGDLASMRLARPFLARRSPLAYVGTAAATRRPGLLEWGRRLGADASLPLIRTVAFGDARPATELLELMNRMIAGTRVDVMTDFLRTFGEHDRFRALAGLRHCEVLVVGGDTDRVTPYRHTEALAAELPDAELVRIPGAGHMAPLESAELVNEHLTGLLRRCHERTEGAG